MTSKDIKPVIEQPDTEIPLMLSQAIIVAGVLAVGELACSPLYFSLLKASLALIPWAMEAVFMAVAFTFVVGFALLWCAESFTIKMRERFRPFAYAIVGLIGYGAWSLLVFSATINSVLAMVGESVLTNGQIGAIALNGARLVSSPSCSPSYLTLNSAIVKPRPLSCWWWKLRPPSLV